MQSKVKDFINVFSIFKKLIVAKKKVRKKPLFYKKAPTFGWSF